MVDREATPREVVGANTIINFGLGVDPMAISSLLSYVNRGSVLSLGGSLFVARIRAFMQPPCGLLRRPPSKNWAQPGLRVAMQLLLATVQY